MRTRYLVHGTDDTTGQRVTKTIEAPTAQEAEAIASRIGVKVLGSEVIGPGQSGGGAGADGAFPLAPEPGLPHANPLAGVSVAPEADTKEHAIWEGSPSQWTNFWWFVAAAVVGAGAIVGFILSALAPVLAWIPAIVVLACVAVAFGRFIVVRSTRFTLTNQRARMEWGLVAKAVEEVELYRVNDTAVRQNVVERLLGIGTVWMETADQRNPQFVWRSVHGPRELREQIRGLSEARRRWRRVAEVDLTEPRR